jgi:hypothetical protein
MFEIGLHNPFGHLKHKLGPKERPRVKLAISLPTTKSQESPQFPCMQVTCNIPFKSSWWGLQLCFKPYLNWRSTCKLMGPQNHKNLNCENFETPTWVLVPWPATEYTIRGKVMASPKSKADALPSPKLGPRWALVSKTMELWGLKGTLPAFSTKKGKGACWSSAMELGRGTNFNYSLEPASNQPTSWLVRILEHPWCKDKPKATLDSQDLP